MTATIDSLPGHEAFDAHTGSARQAQTPAPATPLSVPMAAALGRAQTTDSGQVMRDAHWAVAAVGAQQGEGPPAMVVTSPNLRSLADPALNLAADVLDDLETVRKANENRLRILTTAGPDSDGTVRGFGLDARHPDVARLAALVDGIAALEHQAVLQLQRHLRRHPLGPWVKAQRGFGEKQTARLLAVVGDPYWNTLHGRPRTVSELWAYCGYKPYQRRQRGQKANWSTAAKTRAYLVAESCMKAGGPWRDVYDRRKAATEGRLHAAPCPPCGPKGKPADVGTPWSNAHRHADALRVTAKAILRGLWLEARRVHTETTDSGQGRRDAHVVLAAVGADNLPGHEGIDAHSHSAQQVQAASSGQNRYDAQGPHAAAGDNGRTLR